MRNSILTLAALTTLAACEAAPTQTEIGKVEEIELSEEIEEIECQFEVLTADGSEAIMANTMTVWKGPGGAAGSSKPKENLRALVVEFDTDDSECTGLTVESLRLIVVWTDNAHTNWRPGNFWAIDRSGTTYEGIVQDMGGLLYIDFELDTQVEAGDYSLLAVYVDVTGASTELDDQIRVDLYPDSLVVDDGEVSATLEHEGVGGDYIVF